MAAANAVGAACQPRNTKHAHYRRLARQGKIGYLFETDSLPKRLRVRGSGVSCAFAQRIFFSSERMRV